jgi:hypothetical protein
MERENVLGSLIVIGALSLVVIAAAWLADSDC